MVALSKDVDNVSKPNILLVVIDAFRADKLYEDAFTKTAKTPFLDHLIQNSSYYTNTFSVTSTTTPSFASILTGLYPPNHGIRSLYGYKLNKNIPTLPSILTKNGYNTYAEVTGPLVDIIGLDNGFNEYTHRDTSQTYYSDWGKQLAKKFSSKHFKEPWFIMLHLWELHGPRYVNPEFKQRRYGQNKYDRALSGVDDYLKLLLSNLGDDDIVIITGDHGEEVAQTDFHQFLYKNTLKLRRIFFGSENINTLKKMGHGHNVYDRLTRIPLIIKSNNPELPPGVSSALTSQIDITPTLLNLAEINYQKSSFDGLNLVDIVNGVEKRKYVFSEACGSTIPDKQKWKTGVRTSNYKYIMMPYSQNNKEELYDLKTDRYEKKNISRQKPELTEIFQYLIRNKYLKTRKR